MNYVNPYAVSESQAPSAMALPGSPCAVTEPKPAGGWRRRPRHDRGEGPERVQGLLADCRNRQVRNSATRLAHQRRSRARIDEKGLSTSRRGQGFVISGRLHVTEGKSRARSMPCQVWWSRAVIGCRMPMSARESTAGGAPPRLRGQRRRLLKGLGRAARPNQDAQADLHRRRPAAHHGQEKKKKKRRVAWSGADL